MRKEDVRIGGVYYFNNRSVLIQKEEANGVFFALGSDELELKIKGEHFCTACLAGHMDGTPNVHVCDEYDDVIDEIIDEIGRDRMHPLWIPAQYLREAPFEYEIHQAVSKEVEKVKKSLEEKKKEYSSLRSRGDWYWKTTERKKEEIVELLEKVEELKDEITELKQKKVVISNRIPKTVGLYKSSIKLSTDQLVTLVEKEVMSEVYDSSKIGKSSAGCAISDTYEKLYGDRDIRDVALERVLELIEQSK